MNSAGTRCKDCDRRTPSCHSTCPDYAEFRAKLEAAKEARHREDSALMVTYNKKRRILNYLKRCGIKK